MPMATAEIQERPDQAEALASRDPSELRAGNAVNGERGTRITAKCHAWPRGQ
jgi:hypothetical protein